MAYEMFLVYYVLCSLFFLCLFQVFLPQALPLRLYTLTFLNFRPYSRCARISEPERVKVVACPFAVVIWYYFGASMRYILHWMYATGRE